MINLPQKINESGYSGEELAKVQLYNDNIDKLNQIFAKTQEIGQNLYEKGAEAKQKIIDRTLQTTAENSDLLTLQATNGILASLLESVEQVQNSDKTTTSIESEIGDPSKDIELEKELAENSKLLLKQARQYKNKVKKIAEEKKKISLKEKEEAQKSLSSWEKYARDNGLEDILKELQETSGYIKVIDVIDKNTGKKDRRNLSSFSSYVGKGNVVTNIINYSKNIDAATSSATPTSKKQKFARGVAGKGGLYETKGSAAKSIKIGQVVERPKKGPIRIKPSKTTMSNATRKKAARYIAEEAMEKQFVSEIIETQRKTLSQRVQNMQEELAVIDVETNYVEGATKKDDVENAAVTFGFSNGKDKKLEALIYTGKKDAERVVKFLTDSKLGAARENLAKEMGFVNWKKVGDIIKYYNDKDEEISQSDLIKYVNQTYFNEAILGEQGFIENGRAQIKEAVNALTGQKAHVSGYNVISGSGIGKMLKGKKIVSANRGFDSGYLNNILDKKDQIDDSKAVDIFDIQGSDYHFRSGYDVTTLAGLLLNNDDYERIREGAHGAGTDAEIEALIYSKYLESPEKVKGLIGQVEKYIESRFVSMGGQMYTDKNGEQVYTDEFKKFHSETLKSIVAGTHGKLKQGSKDAYAYTDYSSFLGSGASFVEQIVASMPNNQKFLSGQTTKERISDMTGRNSATITVKSLTDMLAEFYQEAAANGWYVEAQVYDDNGVKKIKLFSLPQEYYSDNIDMEKDAEFLKENAIMLDMVVPDDNSLINSEQAGSISTLSFKGGAQVFVDATMSAAQASLSYVSSIIKNEGKNKKGKDVTPRQTSRTAASIYGDKMIPNTIKVSGEKSDKDWGVRNPTAFQQEKQANTYSMIEYIQNTIGMDKEFASLVIKSKGWYDYASKQWMVEKSAIDKYELDEETTLQVMQAINDLVNLSDEELEQLTYQLKETNPQINEKDLHYQILTSPLAKKFRENIKAEAQKGLQFELTGVSNNSTRSGNAVFGKKIANPLYSIFGQEYSETVTKTQPTGFNTKTKTSEELLSTTVKTAGGAVVNLWEKSAFMPENQEKEHFVTSLGSLPKEILDSAYKIAEERGIIGGSKASSDDILIMPRDVADTLEAVGYQVMSDSYEEGSQEYEYLRSIIDGVDELAKGEKRAVSGFDNITSDLALSNTFKIPKGSSISAIQKDEDGRIRVQYTPTRRVGDGTKFADSGIRSTSSILGASVSALQELLHSGYSSLDDDTKAALEAQGWTEKAINSIIEKNTSFRQAPTQDALADFRKNAQFLAPTFEALVSDVDPDANPNADTFEKIRGQFEKIRGKTPILDRLLEQKDGHLALKENIKWSDFTEEEIAYIHNANVSEQGTKGLFADILDALNIIDPSERVAKMNSAKVALNASGNPLFQKSEYAGGAIGSSAADVNETANVRGAYDSLLKAQQTLFVLREGVIEEIKKSGKSDEEASKIFDDFAESFLKSMIVSNQEAVEKANAVGDAVAQLKTKKTYVAEEGKKIVKIGYAQKTGKVSENEFYINAKDLDFGLRPENGREFTSEEYEKSALSAIYSLSAQADFDVGASDVATVFDSSGLSKEQLGQLSDHGMIKGLTRLGLTRESKATASGGRMLTDEQRETLYLLENINKIVSGSEEEASDDLLYKYQRGLHSLLKNLNKEAISDKMAGSVYLNAAKSGSNEDWINKTTAKNLLRLGESTSNEDLQNLLNDKNIFDKLSPEAQSYKGKKISGEKRLLLIDKINSILESWVDQVAAGDGSLAGTGLSSFIARSPFLSQYSQVFDSLKIKDSVNEDETDTIYLSNRTAELLKGDFDGDIIQVALRRMAAQDNETYEIFIKQRNELLNKIFALTGDSSSGVGVDVFDPEGYQQKLISQASTKTDVVKAKTLENFIRTGGSSIGLNNYQSDVDIASLQYYKSKEGAAGYGKFDFAASLYETIIKQLGEQVGISAKKIGELMLQGGASFDSNTLKGIYDSLRAEMGERGGELGSFDEFSSVQKELFNTALNNLFGVANVAEAQLHGINTDGIFQDGKFNLEETIKFIHSTLSPAFKYIQDNKEEAADYRDTRLGGITGLHHRNVGRINEYITEEEALSNLGHKGANGDSETLASGESSVYVGPLQEIATILKNIYAAINRGLVGGGTQNATSIIRKNLDELIEEQNRGEYSAKFTQATLNQSNHTYKGFGRDVKYYSATGLGSALFEGMSPQDQAQFSKLSALSKRGAISANFDIEKEMESGFKNNSIFRILAANIRGNLIHDANSEIIKKAQKEGKSLDVLKSGEFNYDFFSEDNEFFSQLTNLFGGGAKGKELAEKYIKALGDPIENFKKTLEIYEGQGVNQDLSNIFTEETLGATLTDVSGKQYGLAGTLDSFIFDYTNKTIKSIDLKAKSTKGPLSVKDILEGFVQQNLLRIASQNDEWMKSHGVTDTKDLEAFRKNINENFTQFLKIDGVAATLTEAGLGDNPKADIATIIGLIKYIEQISEGAPKLKGEELPLWENQTYRYEKPREEKQEEAKQSNSKAVKDYLKNYQKEKKLEEQLLRAQGDLKGRTGDSLTAQQQYVFSVQQALNAIKEQNAALDKTKFTQEEIDEISRKTADIDEQHLLNVNKINAAYTKQKGIFQTLFGTFKQAFNRFFDFSASYMIINEVKQIVNDVVRYTEELDSKLVDLQIATGNNRNEMMTMLKDYNVLAKELGRATSSVADAANDWLRAGYKGREATELVKASMYLSTLGMMDATAATSDLISVLKGWQLESSEIIGVVDRLVTVDMQAAVSASDIAEAMQLVNYSAQQAGVSMNTLIGILTTNQEVTQRSAQVVGNSWKTIMARLQNVKAGKFSATYEDMQDSDYAEEDWAALNDVETTLKAIGIDLRETATSWRDAEEVMNEIAENWSTYDDITQSAIANAIAGTRQRENFIATIANWDQVQKYADIAADSYGTAAIKMQAYTDSVEASKNRIVAAVEQWALTIDGAEWMKGFYDFVAYLVENLPALVAAIGGLLIITNLTEAIGLGVTLFGKLGQSVIALGTAFDGLTSDTLRKDVSESIVNGRIDKMSTKTLGMNLSGETLTNFGVAQKGLLGRSRKSLKTSGAELKGLLDGNSYDKLKNSSGNTILAVMNLLGKGGENASDGFKPLRDALEDGSFAAKDFEDQLGWLAEGIENADETTRKAVKGLGEQADELGREFDEIGAGIGGLVGELAGVAAGQYYGEALGLGEGGQIGLSTGLSLVGGMALPAAGKTLGAALTAGKAAASTATGTFASGFLASITAGGMAAIIPVVIAGIIAVGAIGMIAKAIKTANLEKAQEEFKSKEEDYSAKKNVSINAERYNELAKGVDKLGNNISLTDEEYNEYLSLSSDISEAFPELITRVDETGQKFVGLNGVVSELNDTLEETTKQAQKEADEALLSDVLMKDALENSNKELDGYSKNIKALNSALSGGMITDRNLAEQIGFENFEVPYAAHGEIYYALKDTPEAVKAVSLALQELEHKVKAVSSSYIDQYNAMLRLNKGNYTTTGEDGVIDINSGDMISEMSQEQKEILQNVLSSGVIEVHDKTQDEIATQVEAVAYKINVFLNDNPEFTEGYYATPEGYTNIAAYNEARQKGALKLGDAIENGEITIDEAKSMGGYVVSDSGVVTEQNVYTQGRDILQEKHHQKRTSLATAGITLPVLYTLHKNYTGMLEAFGSLTNTEAQEYGLDLLETLGVDSVSPERFLEMVRQETAPVKTSKGYRDFANLRIDRMSETQNAINNFADDRLIDDFKGTNFYTKLLGAETEDDIDKIFGDLPASVRKAIKNNKDDIINAVDIGSEDELAKALFDVDAAIEQIKFKDLTNIAQQELADMFSTVDLGEDGLISSFSELKDVLDSLADSFDKLKQAEKEQATYGELSLATALDLLATDENYIKVLDVTGDKIKLTDDATQIMTQGKIAAAKAGMAQQRQELLVEAQNIQSAISTNTLLEAENDSIVVGNAQIASNAELTASLIDTTEAQRAFNLELMATNALQSGDEAKASSLMAEANVYKNKALQREEVSYAQVDTVETALDADTLAKYLDRFEELTGMGEGVGYEIITDDGVVTGAKMLVNLFDEQYGLGGAMDMGGLIGAYDNVYNSDIWDNYYSGLYDRDRSGDTEKTPLEKLENLEGAINKEYEAWLVKDGFKETEYFNKMTKNLVAQKTEILRMMGSGVLSEEEMLEYQKKLEEVQVKLNNLDDERIEDEISILQNKEASTAMMIEQQKLLIEASDSVDERIEREHELLELYRQQADELEQQLQYQRELIAHAAKYTTAGSSKYSGLMNNTRNSLQQSMANTLARIEAEKKNAYNQYITETDDEGNRLYSESEAWSAALNSEKVMELTKEYLSYVEEFGNTYMEEFNGIIGEIEQKISNINSSKPQVWTNTDDIKNYYASVTLLYENIKKEAKATLQDADKLTDEQIKEVVNKYNDAIVQIHQNAIDKQQAIIDHQESIYSALTNEVQRYIDQIEKEKEIVEETYDKELEKLQDKEDAIARTNKLIELQNNLLNAQKERERVYREGEIMP